MADLSTAVGSKRPCYSRLRSLRVKTMRKTAQLIFTAVRHHIRRHRCGLSRVNAPYVLTSGPNVSPIWFTVRTGSGVKQSGCGGMRSTRDHMRAGKLIHGDSCHLQPIWLCNPCTMCRYYINGIEFFYVCARSMTNDAAKYVVRFDEACLNFRT